MRIWLTALATLPLLSAPPLNAQSPAVIYAIRHAETEADGGQDPGLSAAGKRRAEMVAAVLAGVRLDGVHSTSYRRAAETASMAAGVTREELQVYDPRTPSELARLLLGAGGNHLVVGHSNTVPALVEALGGDPGSPLGESEYDRMYVITIQGPEAHTEILRLSAAAGGGGPGAAAAEGAARSIPPPAIEDVGTIDGIMKAVYDVLSGPAGARRDWDRMRGLFFPGARMIPVQKTQDGRTIPIVLTVEQYIASSGPALTSIGFRESEAARRVEQFGEVAHVFSTYVGYREGVAEPIARGINSLQLIHDGTRWWIAHLTWAQERPDLPIPAEYLRSK